MEAKPANKGFAFNEVTFNDIRDILDGLENKSSKDIYVLDVKIVKCIKNIILVPLTKLVNSSIRARIKIVVFSPTLKKAIKMAQQIFVQYSCY